MDAASSLHGRNHGHTLLSAVAPQESHKLNTGPLNRLRLPHLIITSTTLPLTLISTTNTATHTSYSAGVLADTVQENFHFLSCNKKELRYHI